MRIVREEIFGPAVTVTRSSDEDEAVTRGFRVARRTDVGMVFVNNYFRGVIETLRGALWQGHGLVFASAIGTPLDAANVRREFREITEAAGLGTGWAPRDLRHTFVSLMSANGVPIEEIARLAGHNRTATTELVYRHELRPVITTGAEVMDRILNLRR
jgi:integrase